MFVKVMMSWSADLAMVSTDIAVRRTSRSSVYPYEPHRAFGLASWKVCFTPQVEYWHELSGGYAGRRPITAEQRRPPLNWPPVPDFDIEEDEIVRVRIPASALKNATHDIASQRSSVRSRLAPLM